MKVNSLAAGAADLGEHGLAPCIVQVGDDHLGAFARQRRRTGCANPGCAAGYDGYLALYLAHVVFLAIMHRRPRRSDRMR